MLFRVLTGRATLCPVASERPMRTIMVLGAAFFLAGCATFSQDGGFSAVQETAKERIGADVRHVRSDADANEVRTWIARHLTHPLSADDAVQIALLSNRNLQATYADLGIAEADLVQAGRLINPSWTYRHAQRGDAVGIESVLTMEFVALVTMPLRTRIEARRFEETKLTVGDAVLGVASETRKAYFDAVAAEQSARYLEQVREAAEAGAELARGMVEAGNWSRLNQMREQLFHADAVAQLARARQTASASREKLTRLMGLWGSDTDFKLPDRLPELPAAAASLADIETYAIAERLDLRAARLQTQSVAAALGLSRATRFINVLEAGPAWGRESPEPNKRGYEITLSVPLFDWGDAHVAKAEATYMQAVNRLAQAAVDARSEVREAYVAYVTNYQLAKHYQDEVVPLRKRMAEENLLRYNAMLMSVFELLADAREQVLAVNASIEASRNFWVADTDLRKALGGRLPAQPSAEPMAPPGSAVPTPPPAPPTPHRHEGH